MAASHCAARVGWMENLGLRFRSDGRNRLAVPGQLYYLVPGEFAQPCATSGSRSGTAVAVDHWPRFMQLMIIPRRLRSNFAFNELSRFWGKLAPSGEMYRLRRGIVSRNRARRFSGCPYMNLQQSADGVAEGERSRGAAVPRRNDPVTPEFGPRILRHFSHRCRNSLSGIKLGLYLLKKEMQDPSRSHWHDLGRRCDDIEKLFDRLDRIYQSAPLTLVRSPLGPLFAERLPLWRSLYPDWAQTIVLDPPKHDAAGDFDPSQLGLGLDALVMSRAESGNSREPRLAWQATGAQFEISWQETPARAANQAGSSADPPLGSQFSDCCASLALLLLARVAADHGGALETAEEHGMRIRIQWPQFLKDCPDP